MLSKSLCYLHEVGLKRFAPIFVVFAIFYRSFVKMVMVPDDENGRSSILRKLCMVVEDVELGGDRHPNPPIKHCDILHCRILLVVMYVVEFSKK